jgi:SHS2 domain-containing protein
VTPFAVVPPGTKLTLHIEGNSLPQLFENAARQVLKTFIEPQDVGEVLREKIVVEAADSSLLLKDWINALLSLARQQHILFKAYRFQIFEVERVGAGKLRAEVTGELVDPLRHNFRNDLARWRCAQVVLLNSSKSIEAQVILEFDQANAK